MNKEKLTNVIADFFDIHCEDCLIRTIIHMDVIRELVECIMEEMERER